MGFPSPLLALPSGVLAGARPKRDSGRCPRWATRQTYPGGGERAAVRQLRAARISMDEYYPLLAHHLAVYRLFRDLPVAG
ncbi:hypothetical protein PR002_g2205 [Phytophthora rubi]|uniref:Uncharacterized protein n=1 Tax=Phytophthora rubi TaxID=129364 RepID=A0A6A3NQ23_9STRA|nr:hypothetical protein PR002_g2205 [Phytophthora rubi]